MVGTQFINNHNLMKHAIPPAMRKVKDSAPNTDNSPTLTLAMSHPFKSVDEVQDETCCSMQMLGQVQHV